MPCRAVTSRAMPGQAARRSAWRCVLHNCRKFKPDWIRRIRQRHRQKHQLGSNHLPSGLESSTLPPAPHLPYANFHSEHNICYFIQCTIPYYTLLYYTILYYTILYYTLLNYTILYYTILYYTILYYIILYHTILYYTILYDTILYYTILYYTILYYTLL